VKLQDPNAEALGVPGAEAAGYGLGKSGWVTVPLATPKLPVAEFDSAPMSSCATVGPTRWRPAKRKRSPS
jgi:hypothetical protein